MMAGDEFTQFWLQRNLHEIAKKAAMDAIDNLGKPLPCVIRQVTGQIVTVGFLYENTKPFTLPDLTVPVDNSPYDYVPYQVGDTGIVRPTEIYIGNISGLGSPVPTNNKAPNLGALVFTPVGKKSFIPSNPYARIIQGPDGWIAQTTEGAIPCSIVGNQNGITLIYGATTITMRAESMDLSAAGHSILIDATGITLDGILWDTHVHGGVQPGGADTAGPLNG